ncbi:tetratricopeptide repeat protein [Pasteurella multocida]|uniref:hypothetical protein n=1 Tax=Pasteurella multocida TaxID=747 RepID=UPI000CE7DE50|nr:hypothetical protein [Pasteurella multocida]MCL7817389.1 hypothetical protein [Pasteurella multocida]MDY0577565.1 hypothetical protein [Pasteurella multocida]MEB3457499.1 hypothetical protein [Pasteurella multocida]MEB3467467.1 hypothetical protein [Pasteurella multocida]MEB3472239.1 hypothetical protein [Pasteurella multocida]
MLRIELREDSPGYAQLSARKWKGSHDVELAVQRNQDSHYFAGEDKWTPEPVWHKTTELNVVGDALQGRIGPWLVDGLIRQSGNVRFLLQVRDGQVEDSGPLSLIGNILASSAGGDSSRESDVREMTPPVQVEEVPPVVEITEDPVIDTPIEVSPIDDVPVMTETPILDVAPTPAEQKKSKTGLFIALLILLLGIGAAVMYFLFGHQSSKTETTVVSECSIANSSDELAFIQSCLKTKPNNQRLLDTIAEAKAANKCSIAQRLYAHQAQSGNVELAVAYAKEYATGSPCFALDKENAIYWYETALSIDPNNEAAKKGLAELRK